MSEVAQGGRGNDRQSSEKVRVGKGNIFVFVLRVLLWFVSLIFFTKLLMNRISLNDMVGNMFHTNYYRIHFVTANALLTPN